MINKVQFSYRDRDPFLQLETNYNPTMGDVVYYELNEIQLNNKELRDEINLNLDVEGVICEKWVNLSDKYILWTAYLD